MIKFVTTEDLQDQSMLFGFDTKSVLINHVKEFDSILHILHRWLLVMSLKISRHIYSKTALPMLI